MFIDSAYVILKCTPSTSDLHCLIVFKSVLTNDVLGIGIYCTGGTEHLSHTPSIQPFSMCCQTCVGCCWLKNSRWHFQRTFVSCHCGPQWNGGGGDKGTLPWSPQHFFSRKGAYEAFKLFLTFWPASVSFFFCYPLHCLDSMSELLGRTISNSLVPKPCPASIACSTEKRERAWYIFSREWCQDRKGGRKGLIKRGRGWPQHDNVPTHS